MEGAQGGTQNCLLYYFQLWTSWCRKTLQPPDFKLGTCRNHKPFCDNTMLSEPPEHQKDRMKDHLQLGLHFLGRASSSPRPLVEKRGVGLFSLKSLFPSRMCTGLITFRGVFCLTHNDPRFRRLGIQGSQTRAAHARSSHSRSKLSPLCHYLKQANIDIWKEWRNLYFP